MADQVRVFVSHHHSPEEDAFTARLVKDLEAAGADVWVDDQRITSDDFIKKINEGLAGRQWLVLVMTPQSVASPWVVREVNTALNEHTARRMLGVIPLVAMPTAEQDIPMLWRPLHRYDATTSYETARDGLLGALGLSVPRHPLPTIPASLATLGYYGVTVTGISAIVPPLVKVTKGPFIMGSDRNIDPQAEANELPQQWVDLAAFQVGKYPVTVAEYAMAVYAKAVREPPVDKTEQFMIDWCYYPDVETTWQVQLQHLDHPVVCVSWHDAQAYIAWLRKVTRQVDWRLPSEAEWEKAARWDAEHEASRIYPWGDTFDEERCNTRESDILTTSPVGKYPATDARRSGASWYGVEEMAGSVWEWTTSPDRPYPYSVDDRSEALPNIENRMPRGGSWYGGASSARGARRFSKQSTFFSNFLGFRLAFAPEAAL